MSEVFIVQWFHLQVPDMTMVGGNQAPGGAGPDEYRLVARVSSDASEKYKREIITDAEGRIFTTLSPKSPPSNHRLPRVWSNPQLSSHLRPGLEPPMLQQTNIADASYDLDVTRGLAIKTEREGSPVTPERRQSMPEIGWGG